MNVRDLAAADITQRVAIVPQKPYLFSGTVGSNLRFGNPEATDEELWDALRISQAEDFVRHRNTGSEENPARGLESEIAQGGTNVSGGQRQRLCIARAVASRPVIYLFDDSFSALDVSTDARLRSALAPATRDATVIVVAQRVSTVTGGPIRSSFSMPAASSHGVPTTSYWPARKPIKKSSNPSSRRRKPHE